MNKKIYLLLMFVLATIALYAQQPDTVVVAEPGGFWGFYKKYSEAIWIVLASVGASTFFFARAKLLRNALDKVLEAGDDNSPEGRRVTQAEWQGIIDALKAVWWGGEKKK